MSGTVIGGISIVPTNGGKSIKLAKTHNQIPYPLSWSKNSKSLFFYENNKTTYSLYSLPIDEKPPIRIFGDSQKLDTPGLNQLPPQVSISSDSSIFAFVGQTWNKPPEIYICGMKQSEPKQISNCNNNLQKFSLGNTKLIHWKSLDNITIEGLLTYPVNYEKDKKYPLLLLIHGGPNGADLNEFLPLVKFYPIPVFSDKGYFILRINYRGSTGYGVNFRKDLVTNVGNIDYQDIMSGVDYIINEGFVNPNEMGVAGYSNGGTLTAWIITQTKRFKVACIGAGETNFISLIGTNDNEQMVSYLDCDFISNLDLYIERSPFFHVKGATTPTLIQGGLLDHNVPHTQLMEFYRALKKQEIDVKMIGYPNCTHTDYSPKLYLHFMKENVKWVEKYLK